MDLFETTPSPTPDGHAPLAERMRPRALAGVVGQAHLVGQDGLLQRLVSERRLPSVILWGPPGCGKTTLARLLAAEVGAGLRALSAVTGGVKEIQAAVEWSQLRRTTHPDEGRPVVFIDEIHRHSKSQQDQLLPHVERGTFTLIGATTENPSFEVIAPLLSRCRVLTLQPLELADLVTILERALTEARTEAGRDVLRALAEMADGDARRALNALELAASLAGGEPITLETVREVFERSHLLYDRAGEEHYNQISALHKAIRGSDAQGAVYWCERMLAAGEDALYVARRLIRIASEDIGLADPQALPQALAARQAYEVLGSPEGELAILQAAVYLATAPKSVALYQAEAAAKKAIVETGSLAVPKHIRNAPTALMKSEGYGAGYRYDPAEGGGHAAGQTYLPDRLAGTVFYEPRGIGFEKKIRERIAWWAAQAKDSPGER